VKAISPVIATVIIVAVAIAISIAVALWLTGIVGGFTTVENLQITYAFAEKTDDGWQIRLRVENKGTGTATIDEIFINNRPHQQARAEVYVNNTNKTGNITISISAGDSEEIIIYLPSTGFSSGQQVEVKLHTASGKEYPKMVTLP
jgi:FlaG/FlaF family flagellin (archaellin)